MYFIHVILFQMETNLYSGYLLPLYEQWKIINDWFYFVLF